MVVFNQGGVGSTLLLRVCLEDKQVMSLPRPSLWNESHFTTEFEAVLIF